ncbi:hypothetical protein [Lacticaseibacillus songhuajiangensis]|uniref:hypothetical protein n=1 Tax=Lacticaseibacillus songhuajiangensis TaxID=1296539 RepID=UPI000F76A5C8|nr:hypothetical protein [Lacticaseibacillus songhuajiangensis]
MEVVMAFLWILAAIGAIVGIVLLAVAFATKQKLKMPLIVLGVSVGMFLLSFAYVAAWDAHEDAVAQEQYEQKVAIDKKMDKKFDKAYDEFHTSALMAGSNAEKLCSKVQKTWGDVIFDDSVTISGKTYTDFNDAIPAEIKSQSAMTTIISAAESDMADQLTIMSKNLTNNRKTKIKKAKKIIKAAQKLDEWATSPTGSYSDYSDHVTEADDALSDLL